MKQIQVTLTPQESKRIISNGSKKTPVVQKALNKGIVLINLGTTKMHMWPRN